MSTKSKNRKRTNGNVSDASAENITGCKKTESRSSKLAKGEIRTTGDYARLMAALMADVVQQETSPRIVNAAVNAGRQIIKVCELNLKYGKAAKNLLSGKIG